jgi:hypothetical protein
VEGVSVHTVRPHQRIPNRLISGSRRLWKIVATEAIPLHGIDPQKSLSPKSARPIGFSIHGSGLVAKIARGKYAQMSQTGTSSAVPAACTEAPLAKAPANRISQRPALPPAGFARRRSDMPR